MDQDWLNQLQSYERTYTFQIVLADALGTEAVSVSVGSEGLPGRPPRTYTSLRAMAEEGLPECP
ncbi:hypothetical protein HaLaN_24231 [Haematococcus lacustris]|uniref:Uncharacterized protein n=1 Tax=Haematococcus lacustris TaxID=44745 RepID=A0A6A0A4R0_HAELA|nr:hypothetical protein HaLaN_24231 [Haematococcus lacustris]